MDALCAVQWPALPSNAGPLVPADPIARAAVTAALPVLAAAIEQQARADEREHIAAWVEAECVDLDDDGDICEGCEDTAACIRRGDTTSRLTGGDNPATIARAGASGGDHE